MIALISDIHGNYEALKEVLHVIDSLRIEKVYCLGDVVGYYSQINECCDELRKRNIPCLMGNHDWYLVSSSPCLRSKIVNHCLDYHRKIISDINLIWLSKLPVFIRDNGLSLVHGGWQNPLDEYFTPTIDYFNSLDGSFFSSGHSHLPIIIQSEDIAYCNPGSVGQPRDGNPKASFALFDRNSFKLERVNYNIDKVCKLMDKAGFGSFYYNRLKTGAANFVQ